MDASIEFLENEETKLRQTTANIKKLVAKINEELPCLADEKKCFTSSLNEDRALLQIKSQFFKEFNHTLT